MNAKLQNSAIRHRETVPGARYWSMVVRRGNCLRLTDLEGKANAALLAYNPHNLLERYNVSDTLKGQHTSHLTRGHMLYSDMGRVLLSITEDDLGWHDALGGISDPAGVQATYGRARYQEYRNDFHRSGRELFLVELGKWGLGLRDLVPNVNFFSKVYADTDGSLHYVEGHSRPGASVELRAEMDTLVVLQTAPHPLASGPEYRPTAVEVSIYPAAAVGADDYCINFRPENGRAYANTAIYTCQEQSA